MDENFQAFEIYEAERPVVLKALATPGSKARDDVDPGAYSSGVCILHGDAFAKLWAECRRRKMTVVADAHTHPDAAFQSWSDKANPMVARAGHIAIIIPNYARMPVRLNRIRIYEYCGQHEWIDRSPSKEPEYFYKGFWS